MKRFLIFGSHPLLSLAEAKAVLDGRKPVILEAMAAFDLEDWDGRALNDRLGGTVKLGDVIAEVPVADLSAKLLADEIEKHPRAQKIEFGLTVYGASMKHGDKGKKLAIQLKRELQERGHAARWVTGEQGGLSPAAVAKARLIDQGYDFVIGLTDQVALIGLTTHVQNADAWSRRDYGRPFRDEVTGMLPPKLARMMVNLGMCPGYQRSAISDQLMDPFCGGGTILMEAALAGATTIIGSDIDARQVAGANQNLDWLAREKILTKPQRASVRTLVSPAETIHERLPLTKGEWPKAEGVAIVTEGYLGKPLTGQETKRTLEDRKREIETIWRESLASFAKIQNTGARLVCVWPVWTSSHGTVVVDLKKEVERLGYRLIDPLAGWKDKPVTLTYARANQRVKRNITVMERA